MKRLTVVFVLPRCYAADIDDPKPECYRVHANFLEPKDPFVQEQVARVAEQEVGDRLAHHSTR